MGMGVSCVGPWIPIVYHLLIWVLSLKTGPLSKACFIRVIRTFRVNVVGTDGALCSCFNLSTNVIDSVHNLQL